MRLLLNELATGNSTSPSYRLTDSGNNLLFKSSFLELLNLTLVAANEADKPSLINAFHKHGINFHFFQVISPFSANLTPDRSYKRIFQMRMS